MIPRDISQEKMILKSENAVDAYNYANDVIRGRWPEAEPFIMKDLSSSYCYAKYVIKGRWIGAEPFIIKDHIYYMMYMIYVLKGDMKYNLFLPIKYINTTNKTKMFLGGYFE